MTAPRGYDVTLNRARLALLVAVLDGECDQRVHELLCRDDRPHLGVEVAHRMAHDMVASIDPDDHTEMRADLAAELLDLAGEPDAST